MLTKPQEEQREELRLQRTLMNICIKVSCSPGDDFFMQALHRQMLPHAIKKHRELMLR